MSPSQDDTGEAVLVQPDTADRMWSTLRGLSFPAIAVTILLALVVISVVANGGTETGDQILTGLQVGAIYALIAVGYTMVYGIIELINFAHGDVFTLSAFYAITIVAWSDDLHLPIDGLATQHGFFGLVAAIAILITLTMIATGLTGVAIERLAYRRLRNSPRLAALITAIGMSFLLEGIMFAFFVPSGGLGGSYATGMDSWIGGIAFTIGGVIFDWGDLFVIVAAVLLMIGVQRYIQTSRLGKAMRASAQDRDAALICGININRTIAATFFIGSALAAAAGVVYATHYHTIVWNQGYRFGIVAFTAAVLGGIGNIVGAGIGGFIIGLIEVFSGSLLPNGGGWSDAIIFAILILILTLRPSGLLGVQVPDRA
jgi:branched-chain amino acid transport system permease protein